MENDIYENKEDSLMKRINIAIQTGVDTIPIEESDLNKKCLYIRDLTTRIYTSSDKSYVAMPESDEIKTIVDSFDEFKENNLNEVNSVKVPVATSYFRYKFNRRLLENEDASSLIKRNISDSIYWFFLLSILGGKGEERPMGFFPYAKKNNLDVFYSIGDGDYYTAIMEMLSKLPSHLFDGAKLFLTQEVVSRLLKENRASAVNAVDFQNHQGIITVLGKEVIVLQKDFIRKMTDLLERPSDTEIKEQDPDQKKRLADTRKQNVGTDKLWGFCFNPLSYCFLYPKHDNMQIRIEKTATEIVLTPLIHCGGIPGTLNNFVIGENQ